MPECPNPADGFGFSKDAIAAAVAGNGLLSIELELTLSCNFRCPYCYTHGEQPDEAPLSDAEIFDVIEQARALGAKRIILLGGEPMLHPSLHAICAHIDELGMATEIFTNGSKLTQDNADFFFDHRIAVVLKMNSFQPQIQNLLTGRDDGHRILEQALATLTAAGYPAPARRLAVSTVICRQNVDELPELWRWLRRRHIDPYVEMITPQGSAMRNEWLSVPVARQHELFETLSAIDRTEFGRDWDPQPPLAGNACLRHQFSCLISASGRAYPCVGVTIPVGTIREQKLADIISESEILQTLRHFSGKIKAPCGDCDKAEHCYGCRGAAYQLTGDYLASDPLCWRNQQAAIEKLPVAVGPYLPQRAPMQLVDTLVSVGEGVWELEYTVPAEGLFVGPDLSLDDSAYLELIAQSVAGANGFQTPARERARLKGFLLGAKDLKIHGSARAGDRLRIMLNRVATYGDFGIVAGVVARGDEILAEGEVKVWQNAAENAEAALD